MINEFTHANTGEIDVPTMDDGAKKEMWERLDMDIQTQVQEKMQEMLADRLMSKRCEMFEVILAGDITLMQEIIHLVCSDTSPLGEDVQNRMINSLGPSYASYCQELVLGDIADEEQYQKEAAIDMEIEQRRLR